MVVSTEYEKFYTTHGIESLNRRLNDMIEAYNNRNFPISAICLGFSLIHIGTKEECKFRLLELAELIDTKIYFEKHIIDGKVEKEICKR